MTAPPMMPWLERREQVLLVGDLGAGDIDDQRRRLHSAKLRHRQHAARRLGQRTGEHEVIGGGEHLVEAIGGRHPVDVGDAVAPASR